MKVAQSCPTLFNPWNSPGQNTEVGSLFLLQGIFPTQGWKPGLPHSRCILLCYVMLCYVMLCYVMLCYVMLCYVCYVMLCYVMLCYMLCYVMLCYVMLWSWAAREALTGLGLLLKGHWQGQEPCSQVEPLGAEPKPGWRPPEQGPWGLHC